MPMLMDSAGTRFDPAANTHDGPARLGAAGSTRRRRVRFSEIEVVDATGVCHRMRELVKQTAEILTIVPTCRIGERVKSVTPALVPGQWAMDALARLVINHTVIDHAADRQMVLRSIDGGAEVRTAPRLPAWMTIIGRSVVALPIDCVDPTRGILLLHGAQYVGPALWMFDHAWRSAIPLRRGSAEPALLTVWQSRVLSHLVRGQKDESAARELGVSARTYRRHVSELCCALGASSRFEAGALAARAGLI